MGCDIGMHDSPSAHLHDDKNINDAESGSYQDEEVTGQHGLGMIANKGHPSLGGNRVAPTAVRILRQILPDRTRRDLNPKLDQELGCYSLLTPGGIISRHGQDELPEVLGNPGSADLSRFPTPEQFEALAMPSDEGLWSNRD